MRVPAGYRGGALKFSECMKHSHCGWVRSDVESDEFRRTDDTFDGRNCSENKGKQFDREIRGLVCEAKVMIRNKQSLRKRSDAIACLIFAIISNSKRIIYIRACVYKRYNEIAAESFFLFFHIARDRLRKMRAVKFLLCLCWREKAAGKKRD